MHIDQIATVTVHGAGERMDLSLRPINERSALEYTIEGRNLRDTAFQLISTLLNAVATLELNSVPVGAQVWLNDELVGETPYTSELPIGVYRMQVILDGYETHDEILELRPEQQRRHDLVLTRTYSTLTVVTITPEATLTIDRELHPELMTSITLEPGTHEVFMEAPGYESETVEIVLETGTDERLRLDLRESEDTIRTRQINFIYDRPLYIQGGLSVSGTRASLEGATGEIDGTPYRINCPQEIDTGNCDSTGVAQNWVGLEFEVGYAFRYVEVSLLSMSYAIARVGDSDGNGRIIQVSSSDDETEVGAGQLRSMNRFQLTPFGVGGRWVFDPNWSAIMRTNFNWYHDFFQIRNILASTSGEGEFSRNGWIWDFELGVRYHLNDTVFFSGQFNLSNDLTHDDSDALLGVSIGAGMTWEDILGVSDWFSFLDPRRIGHRAPEDETP
jgi:hypothetical protein